MANRPEAAHEASGKAAAPRSEGVQWTPEQSAAIERRGEHILVSAAAGAGKTAVLVERVIRRLLDSRQPSDIDRFLIVTFTEAAAAQMRERIGIALQQAVVDERRSEKERTHLRRQLMLLDRAPIQTLHSFCHSLIRRYFYLLDLDPRLRVLEEDEAALLRSDILDDVFERSYTAEAPQRESFYRLLDAYGGRDDRTLKEATLRLHAYISSLPDPRTWLNEAVERYRISAETTVNDLPWTAFLLQQIAARLAQARALWTQALRLAEAGGADEKAIRILADELQRVTDWTDVAERGDWRNLEAALADSGYERLTLRGVDDLVKARIQAARNQGKDVIKRIREAYFVLPEATQLQLLRETEGLVDELVRLVSAFDEAYQAAKRRRGVVDFNDLERYALQLLQTEPGDSPHLAESLAPRDELRRSFDEVLVDEYQDINPLQDRILAYVSRPADDTDPNLFMVGDVKQSIYKFRMADPSLFLGHLERFTPLEDVDATEVLQGVRIDLSANFRSREHIIAAVNFLFRQILVPSVGGIAYDERAELVPGASYPPIDEARVEVHLLERAEDRVPARRDESEASAEAEPAGDDDSAYGMPDDEAQWTALEREAWFTAKRVRQLIDEGMLVFDRDEGGMRPIRPRDIVLLLRSTKVRANPFVEAFRALDIPVYAESGTGYYWAVEVESMVSLLRVIENPRQDIPLAAVLRLPWINLTTHDLARIRLHAPEGEFYDAVVAAAEGSDALARCLRNFLAQLDRWRTLARSASLGELVRQILQETGYREYLQGLPGGRQRCANLDLFLERARRFDVDAQDGLRRFLRALSLVESADWDEGEAPIIGEGEDVVRIMSIHKSKGLQFPVVIVPDCGKEFNLSDAKGSILYQGDLGIGLEWVDPQRGVQHPTLAHVAVVQARRLETLAEELRILYVALTRAQEQLIVIGSVEDVNAACAGWSEAVDHVGWPLPDHIVLQAKTYLDWIVPALMRHADGQVLRECAEAEGGRGVHVHDAIVAADSARWKAHIHTYDAVSGGVLRAKGGGDDPAWLKRLSTGQPLGRTLTEAMRRELSSRIEWSYPEQRATLQPAKVSVSLLARTELPAEAHPLRLPGEGDDGVEIDLSVPSWLASESSESVQPIARGLATHLLLDRLDLTLPVTEHVVRSTLESLVESGLVQPIDAAAVDIEAIVRFFGSEVGGRLCDGARRGKLWREWSFTVGIDAAHWASLSEVEGVISGRAKGDMTLLQGTIDALWQEPDGRFVLLDYKTDRVASSAALVRRYRKQLSLYAYAVMRILGEQPTVYLIPLGMGAPPIQVAVDPLEGER